MRKHIQGLLGVVINQETIAYLVAGVLTTLVDFAVFTLVNELMSSAGMDEVKAAMLAQLVSWTAAVVFAYVTNKLLVFKNHDLALPHLIREAASFVAARMLSGLLVMALIWIMVDLMKMNEYIAKLFTSVINVVFNYVASKRFIFTKK